MKGCNIDNTEIKEVMYGLHNGASNANDNSEDSTHLYIVRYFGVTTKSKDWHKSNIFKIFVNICEKSF